MKGIILVGGLGTRLEPMTRVTNKHLLPVGQFPMVYYPLHTLVDAGIRDIMIVTGGNNPGAFLELLHDGREFGLDHLYFTYQREPQGIADAVRWYMYDQLLWEILPILQLSDRGQYEVTDIHNVYLERGLLTYDIIDFGWSDAGTPESLFRATQMMHNSDFLPPPNSPPGQ